MPDPVDKIRKSQAERSRPAGGASGARGAEPEGVDEGTRTQFQNILDTVANAGAEKRLAGLFGEIQGLARVLAKRRLLEDLESYREKIAEFLRVYLDEVLTVRLAAGRKGLSKRKQLLVVKRVNVELEELSRFVLDGAPDFKILKELGTIEGLLLDLYR